MEAQAQYLETLIPELPGELGANIRDICSMANVVPYLEDFLRFVVGAEPSISASETLRREWQEKQTTARGKILSLIGPTQSQSDGRKRALNDTGGEMEAKRQRISPPSNDASPTNDPAVFIIHSISATSPVRRKVDIAIGKATITLKHATSGNIEATIPLSSIKRAFLLPTRGKSKPHWTVVLLSADSAEKVKGGNTNVQDSLQIVFGLDATTTSPLATSYVDGQETKRDTIPKGSPALPAIRNFLSQLTEVKLHEPSTDVFKSACNGIGSSASTTGIPGVEAHRAAKQGNLWFMKEGILWGESKPCEFWSVEDLLSSVEGVRLSPGSGRVFSITLTRKVEPNPEVEDDGENEGKLEGIETELAMVDSKERDVVADWVRKHQNLFGRKAGEAPVSAEELKKQQHKTFQFAGPMTIHQLAAESDSEDEDFKVGSSEDEGSAVTNDEASEVGSEASSGDEDDVEGTDEDGEGEDEDRDEAEDDAGLDPKGHPLMRPGAVPKMSKAAMAMVVDMVEGDLLGVGNQSDGDELEDELEDDD